MKDQQIDDLLAGVLADILAGDKPEEQPAPASIIKVSVQAEAEELPRPDMRAMCAEQAAADPDRLPWPDAWFAQTDSAQAQACRDLWGAVLLACIRSSLGADGANDRRATKSINGLNESWFWSRDFHIVAALAGFDGVALSERLTDPVRRDQIIANLFGVPKGGASHALHKSKRSNQ